MKLFNSNNKVKKMKSVLTFLLLLIAQVFVMKAEISYYDYLPDTVLTGDWQHPMLYGYRH
jgi:hypothetical protein